MIVWVPWPILLLNAIGGLCVLAGLAAMVRGRRELVVAFILLWARGPV